MALVLFSGGCDSSLVLHDLLKENSKSYKGNIIALSINHSQVPANSNNKAARESFKEEMQRRELNSCVIYSEIDITSNIGVGIPGEYGLTQPIIWSTIAMLYASNQDTVYFGYHGGDDFWLHKTDFENAIYSICKVCNKDIKIEYPLKGYYKPDIIKMLKERGLYEKCWWCEYPIDGNIPCGNCIPCRTHRQALWHIEIFGNTPPTVDNYSINRKPILPLPSQDLNIVKECCKELGITPHVDYSDKKCVMLKGT